MLINAEEVGMSVDTHNPDIKLTPTDSVCLGNALIAEMEKDETHRKNAINSLMNLVNKLEPAARLAFYQHLKNCTNTDDYTLIPTEKWRDIINIIPTDPIHHNNIFAQPIAHIDTNTPRQEDIRKNMSRDLNHYRYIAPNGTQGAWYLGCYQTPDGKIHTQRFMMKREPKCHKNIIESLCGRLKASLVNLNEDYIAATYLVRDQNKKATGQNVYVASIAFDEFKEIHQLVNDENGKPLDHHVNMASIKGKWLESKALEICQKIEALDNNLDHPYEGLEEILLSAWWTGDNDLVSNNIGVNDITKHFLSINHANSMINLDPKVHPNRSGIWQHMKRISPPQKMAVAIKHYANNMTVNKIKHIVSEEIDTAASHFADDPTVFKRFAKRIGAPIEHLLHKKITAHTHTETIKIFLTHQMVARLIHLRQYGNEIKLKNPKKLEEKDFAGIRLFLLDDFNIANLADRSQNYLTRLHLIQIILKDPTHAYHEKINDLIEYLHLYIQEEILKINSRKQHLTQLIDDAYKTIYTLYQKLDNKKEHDFIQKIKIYEIFSKIYLNHPQIMTELNHIRQSVPLKYNNKNNERNIEINRRLQAELENNEFSIDKSALAQTVCKAARFLRIITKDIQLDKEQCNDIELIKKEYELIYDIHLKLRHLAVKNNEQLEIIQETENHLTQTEHDFKPKSEAEIRLLKKYLASAHQLKKEENQSFLELANTYFKRDPAISEANIHAVVASTLNDNTAMLLDNPTTTTKAGALILQEAGTTKIFDFEDTAISSANILATLLSTPNSPTDELRKYIQENYIDTLQQRNPPEMVTLENLKKDLIRPLLDCNQFALHLPKVGFFNTSKQFSEHIFREFEHKTASYHLQWVKWANIWIETLEAQGHQACDISIKNARGNYEFARLFLMLICTKGANPLIANQTGYHFQITEKDKARILTMINNTNQQNEPLKKVVALNAPGELVILINNIRAHLDQPLDDTSIEDLIEIKRKFKSDKELLGRLDTQGKYVQLYSDVPSSLIKKIETIDNLILIKS